VQTTARRLYGVAPILQIDRAGLEGCEGCGRCADSSINHDRPPLTPEASISTTCAPMQINPKLTSNILSSSCLCLYTASNGYTSFRRISLFAVNHCLSLSHYLSVPTTRITSPSPLEFPGLQIQGPPPAYPSIHWRVDCLQCMGAA